MISSRPCQRVTHGSDGVAKREPVVAVQVEILGERFRSTSVGEDLLEVEQEELVDLAPAEELTVRRGLSRDQSVEERPRPALNLSDHF